MLLTQKTNTNGSQHYSIMPVVDRYNFGSMFRYWHLNVLAPSLALSTFKRYQQEFNLRISKSVIMAMPIADVNSFHIQEMYSTCIQQGASANSIRIIHHLLSSFFRYCLKLDMLAKSPADACTIPKNRQVKKQKKPILSIDDIKLMVRYAQNNPSAFVFIFAIFTGLRQGEILALTHKDIKNNMVHVNKTLSYLSIDGKYRAIVSPTKTEDSNRIVPILENLMLMLAVHIKTEEYKHKEQGIKFSKDNPLFTSSSCSYDSPSNLRKKLLRIYERLNIEPTTFHGLRHTFCSALAKNGVQIKTASELMGHASTSTTLKIYTHVEENELQQGIASLAGIFPM